MKRSWHHWLLPLSLLFALCGPLSAQGDQGGGAGGSYSGPGDTVPQGPRTPTEGGPGAGGSPGSYDGPVTAGPGPSGPAGPTMAPGSFPVAPPPGTGSPLDPTEPEAPGSRPRTDDPNSWQHWWHYNRWSHLRVGGTSDLLATTGTGGFFLGRGEKLQTPPIVRATRTQVHEVVWPALYLALENSTREEVSVQTVLGLAKLRGVYVDQEGREFADAVRIALADGNQLVAEKAVLAIGVRGEDRYLGWLLGILFDEEAGHELTERSRIGFRMRAFAAYALGLLGERSDDPLIRSRIHDALNVALEKDREEVQAACLLAMGRNPMPLETEPVPGSDALPSGLVTRVDQVLDVLEFFEDDNRPFRVRSQAPNALARLLADAPDSLVTRVAHALLLAIGPHVRESQEVQAAAVIALGEIGTSGTDPIDQEIRRELERVAYRSSANRLTRYLAMIALAEAASRPGEGELPFAGLAPARKLFLRNMARNRGQTLCWTALALGVLEENAVERGSMAPPESAAALRHALSNNRSAEVVGAVALAIGMLQDSEAEDVLLARLAETGEQNVRGYCSLALGMIGAPRAMGPLRRVLIESTNQSFTIEQTAIALSLLGDQETGERLMEMMAEASSPEVQASIASALGWIQDPRQLEELARRLNDQRENDTSRAWTALALGRICDEDSIPWVGRYSTGVAYLADLPTLIDLEYHTGLLDQF